MSELIQIKNRENIRFGLLVTTSVVVLAACVASMQEVIAADRPTFWIEGGWQFENITGSNDIVTPPLDELTTKGYTSVPTAAKFLGQGAGGFPSFIDMEKALGKSGGAEGSISFQPTGSDWIFNISGRYGRTHSHRRLDERKVNYGETAYVGTTALGIPFHKTIPQYANYVVQTIDNTESHTILDFQVGKDIGVGLFGSRTESVLSLGARYAQMSMTSKGHSYAAPGVRFYGHGINNPGKYQYVVLPYHQNSATTLQRYSSFHAIGPSLSWNNTTTLLGNSSDGELAVDWGANAAVLFGRQKVQINASTMYNAVPQAAIGPHNMEGNTINRTQSHRVTVPNLGGFAALSYHFPNAKLSAGYRADFFFGAMDGGLDTRKSITTGFHGPYATIAIGLGG